MLVAAEVSFPEYAEERAMGQAERALGSQELLLPAGRHGSWRCELERGLLSISEKHRTVL